MKRRQELYLARGLHVCCMRGHVTVSGELFKMDFKNLSVFNTASHNMQYLSAKQKVIAENIANVNTPGYVARDIEKPSFESDVSSSVALKLTNPKHIGLKNSRSYRIYTPNPTAALTIDGNGVILEDQMNQASKASSEYKKTITILNKYKSLLQIANTKINA